MKKTIETLVFTAILALPIVALGYVAANAEAAKNGLILLISGGVM